MHIDDAIQFLSNYARRRCTDGGGRDIYIPEVLNGYWTEVLERPLPESLINSPEGRPFVPVFCDAAWELCRRCDYTMERCLQEPPPWRDVGSEHQTRCWLEDKHDGTLRTVASS